MTSNHASIWRVTALAALALLQGCAAEGPAGEGASVRALMASQAIAPRPQAARGGDGVTAVAAYADYKRSFASPQPQGDRPLVGTRN